MIRIRAPGRRDFLAEVDLPAQVAAVPQARRYVRDLLDGVNHPHADDALLLLTELVTNSVRHSDSGRTRVQPR
ncbi:hypothetical protein OG884_00985 [Streptosporangium sp. NBC_01755]|uniref:hypothetical protein n=1 Tax=unclassified Streptosporangium TaxID=2632669 RepID=UPI002DD8CEDE|nr:MULTISPECIES: hypothetical protein [unclassified Streptosporangium]WSA27980.1 hypothetical protein OIE13_08985 [Streptosporangium sp. NBC_01810]WSD00549.1 hypothetical protein OG884_00985 [Streptosporangium sp. NBC_01755]